MIEFLPVIYMASMVASLIILLCSMDGHDLGWVEVSVSLLTFSISLLGSLWLVWAVIYSTIVAVLS